MPDVKVIVKDSADDPYFVEVDSNGCSHCGAGRTYCVIGPDGVASGT
jgi:hypothetical protein